MVIPDKTFVLINPDPIKEVKTSSGIIVTTPPKKTHTGQIIAIGKDVEGIEVGNRVTYFTLNAVLVKGMYLVDTDEKDCKIVCVHN